MASQTLIDPLIFQDLQTKIDEDSELRTKLRDILQNWEKQQRHTTSILSRVHSLPQDEIRPLLQEARDSIESQVMSVNTLKETALNHPYWKYNSMWSREIQNLLFSLILCQWLLDGKLFRLEECGATVGVPVNLKNEDAFHITIEEYLHAIVSLTEELSRLAVNAVTVGDYGRPLQISKFVKDLHAGFQLLNLKNDSLRRRVDSVKYNVKKVEDVVYDLSLRNLVPK